MQLVKPALVASLILLTAPMAGCLLAATPGTVTFGGGNSPTTVAGTAAPTNGNLPVIHSFTANPTSSADKNTTITFQVVATSGTGAPLQYNWSTTKGSLSTTSGQIVSWHAGVNADGSVDSGVATVSVTVSDGNNVTSGSLNITIAGNGATSVAAAPSTAPTTAPASNAPASASPSAATSTSPSPSASASTAATATASPVATASPATSAAAASGGTSAAHT